MQGSSIELRNVGVNGYTSEDVVRDELPELGSFEPTFVTIAVGANDIVQGRSEEAYRASVKRIVTAAKAAGARVVRRRASRTWRGRTRWAASLGGRPRRMGRSDRERARA